MPGINDPIVYVITIVVGAVTSLVAAFWQRAKSATAAAAALNKGAPVSSASAVDVAIAEAEQDIAELKEDMRQVSRALREAVDLLSEIREVTGRNDERLKFIVPRIEKLERDVYALERKTNSRFNKGAV